MIIINQTYTVVSGDTLYGISNQYGVSVSELIKLNNVDPNKLQIGQVLKIPITSGTNPNNIITYTVKKGDTLYSLGQKYGTSVDQIIKLNNLKSNTLSIGQVLKIPETYTSSNDLSLPNYISYIVKKGDNIYSIGRQYNIDVDTIIKDNSLSSDLLTIGQVLKIRTKDDTLVEECFGTDYNPNIESNTTYVVKKGDNLYSIARRFNTTVDSIKKKNNLKSNLLSIGQKLII